MIEQPTDTAHNFGDAGQILLLRLVEHNDGLTVSDGCSVELDPGGVWRRRPERQISTSRIQRPHSLQIPPSATTIVLLLTTQVSHIPLSLE